MSLSSRQQEVLSTLTANGGNQVQAAKVLKISRSTLKNHIENIRSKGVEVPTQALGFNNRKTNYTEDGYRIKGRSTLYGPDGETKLTWERTDSDAKQREAALEAALEGFKDRLPKVKPTKQITKNTDSDLLNLFVLTDYHLGMYAWHQETGADWDLEIAENLLYQWITSAVRSAPKAQTAILAQLGDFIHFDSLEAITPAHKNLLDADTRFQMIVRVAIRSIRRVITELLKKHEQVHVIMAEGNHDPASSVWLRELFSAFYDGEPRLTVDENPNPYYCYQHGDVSLFFHHGHKRNPKNVSDVFAAQYRDVFGTTKHSYAHMGHLHHQRLETNLMLVEQHRTLAAPDAYAARGGWISSRDAKTITYHKRYGEVARVSVTPEMLD